MAKKGGRAIAKSTSAMTIETHRKKSERVYNMPSL